MRAAAGNREFEEAARLRDELEHRKLMDLQFANDQIGDRGKVDTKPKDYAAGTAEGVSQAKRTGRRR